jgi:hypothetical protein
MAHLLTLSPVVVGRQRYVGQLWATKLVDDGSYSVLMSGANQCPMDTMGIARGILQIPRKRPGPEPDLRSDPFKSSFLHRLRDREGRRQPEVETLRKAVDKLNGSSATAGHAS